MISAGCPVREAGGARACRWWSGPRCRRPGCRSKTPATVTARRRRRASRTSARRRRRPSWSSAQLSESRTVPSPRSPASPSSMSSSSSPFSGRGSMAETYSMSPSSWSATIARPHQRLDAVDLAHLVGDRGREALADHVADDVVADEVVLDQLVDAGLGRRAEDRHRAGQGQPDHQRGGGGRGPARVAQRVLAGEVADRSRRGGRRRPGPPIRNGRPITGLAAAAPSSTQRTPPPTNQPGRGTSSEQPGDQRLATPTTTARRRRTSRRRDRGLGQRDVVAQRLDRRDPRGTPRGQLGRRHGDDARPRRTTARTVRGGEDERLARRGRARSGEERLDARAPAASRGRARWSSRPCRPRRPPSAPTRVTCRREAPRARSRASSRLRWATRIENVLTIRKAPTTSAMPAKISRNVGDEPRSPRAARLPLSSAASSPVTASTPSGSSAATASRELLLGDAVLGGHPQVGVDVLDRRGSRSCVSRGVEDRERGAVERAAVARSRRCPTSVGLDRGCSRRRRRLGTCRRPRSRPCRRCRRRARPRRALRHPALDRSRAPRCRSGGRVGPVDAEAGGAGAADHLAVLADDEDVRTA